MGPTAVGCARKADRTEPSAAIPLRAAEEAPARAPVKLRLATTTSTENTGLLDVLLPPFEAANNVKVEVIAVGTGKALELGRNGDVDVVLVHAREDEDQFVAEGHGVNRRDVMYNDFVLLGPVDDPAGIRGQPDAVEALRKIAQSRATFCSRGDDSGTYNKEKQLWQQAGLTPSGAWYQETGQGMGPTLTVADEKRAYCLSDRATFLAYQGRIELAILCEGDERLFNPYGIIAVNPDKHEDVKYEEAMKLIEWVTSEEGQKIIGDFQVNGEVLFHPSAKSQD